MEKRYQVYFFGVLTHVAQVLIFFLLGLLVTPVQLPAVLLPALAIMAFLTLAARPLVCAVLLLPFRAPWGQIGVTAWAGLRGAASIVFAISAVLSGIDMQYDLFNLVFCVVLLSMAIQGTLLPWVAGRLSMTDQSADVGKTFTDYQEES
ncbi:cation:proton antiporter, partial [Pseudoflavonifractor phocaeensis]|uniref:cation:proton antiporter domain-containing protein n=1 Tax=Pseudoflavonifractor phocaeensis TaxID=1870988 RepID=UPI0030B919C5